MISESLIENFRDNLKKILVTGAGGQLGKSIREVSKEFSELDFSFMSKEDLDIAHPEKIKEVFDQEEFHYCINTAAYTNVEKAESEEEKAFAINAEAVKNLALACEEKKVILIHVSTDYVFDGESKIPYKEDDKTNPVNVYGASKLKGEEYIREFCSRYFIFRTSWLYSPFGHNFFKSIIKKADEGEALTITTEQTGSPTNALDLARAILSVISESSEAYGLYHFSNEGQTTWYGFAKAILKFSGKLEGAKLAKTEHYRTFAKRPKYSVLDLKKIDEKLNLQPVFWEESLKEIIDKKIII